MLHFSDQALQVIRSAIAQKTPTPRGLRVGVVGSPCSGLRYVIRLESQATSEDLVIDCQGLTLLVDLPSAPQLEGVRVDYVESAGRRGFTFENPNLAGRCAGCTQSRTA